MNISGDFATISLSMAKTDVNATILSGLPGDGPAPLHFHVGKPTPWREGLPVRFQVESGSYLVGNFQSGQRDYSTVIVWEEAKAVICVARGFLYLVPYANLSGRESEYTAFDGAFGAVAISSSGKTLYAVDAGRVLAFDSNLRIRWDCQEEIWKYGSYVALDCVRDGAIFVSAQFDLDGPWTPYVLAECDGKLICTGS